MYRERVPHVLPRHVRVVADRIKFLLGSAVILLGVVALWTVWLLWLGDILLF
jgi:hypothetical protein